MSWSPGRNAVWPFLGDETPDAAGLGQRASTSPFVTQLRERESLPPSMAPVYITPSAVRARPTQSYGAAGTRTLAARKRQRRASLARNKPGHRDAPVRVAAHEPDDCVHSSSASSLKHAGVPAVPTAATAVAAAIASTLAIRQPKGHWPHPPPPPPPNARLRVGTEARNRQCRVGKESPHFTTAA